MEHTSHPDIFILPWAPAWSIFCLELLLSRCLQKYCICFNAGVRCDDFKCKCLDCLNEEEEESSKVAARPFIQMANNAGISSVPSDFSTAAFGRYGYINEAAYPSNAAVAPSIQMTANASLLSGLTTAAFGRSDCLNEAADPSNYAAPSIRMANASLPSEVTAEIKRSAEGYWV